VVSFTPQPLYTRGKSHWLFGWVDPRPGLDDVKKRMFLTLPGLELQPIASPNIDYTIIAPRRNQCVIKIKWAKIYFKIGKL
jgi:hypothetical protein